MEGPMNTASVPMPEKVPEPVSASVQMLRERFDHGDAHNALDEAERIANHIRAIDVELDALSDERGRPADRCIKSADVSRELIAKMVEIARNDYREPNHPNQANL